LITSYIGFKSIIDIPSIYLGSINNMPVKGEIGGVSATRPRKSTERGANDVMWGHSFFNAIYVLCKFFFKTFYFYFFTFAVIFVPLVKVLKA